MYEVDDDDDGSGRSPVGRIVLAVLLALGVWYGYQKLIGSGGASAGGGIVLDPPAPPSAESTIAESSDPDTSAPGTTEHVATSRPTSLVPTTRASTTVPPTTASPTTVRPTTAATHAVAGPTTTVTTVPPTTAETVPPATAATTVPAPVPSQPGSVLPNGIAIGAMVSFDGDVVTMRGSLPTEQAHDRLLVLVTTANTTGEPIVDEITIDSDAPGGDSVRFVGLDPIAFPEGTPDIHPPHAAELDRVASLLNAFPRVTIVVVGRSDQRGSSERNFGIAERRAEALVAYLVSRGIDPGRVTPVAFGEMQPTSEAENGIALALNRRAEFILYNIGR